MTRRVGDGRRCATTCDDDARTEPLVADCRRRTGGRARSLGVERSADRHARCYGNSTTSAVDDSGCSVNGIAQAAIHFVDSHARSLSVRTFARKPTDVRVHVYAHARDAASQYVYRARATPL